MLLFVVYIKRVVKHLWKLIYVSKMNFLLVLFSARFSMHFTDLQNSFHSSYCRWFWAPFLLTDSEFQEDGPQTDERNIITLLNKLGVFFNVMLSASGSSFHESNTGVQFQWDRPVFH